MSHFEEFRRTFFKFSMSNDNFGFRSQMISKQVVKQAKLSQKYHRHRQIILQIQGNWFRKKANLQKLPKKSL